MARQRSLGKLFIVWGPDAIADLEDPDVMRKPHTDAFRRNPDDVVSWIKGFHGKTRADDPDPFDSMFFGFAAKGLLIGRPVVLLDRRFEDPRTRRKAAKAFSRVSQTWTSSTGSSREPTPESGADGPDQGLVIDDDVYDDGDITSNETIVVESTASVAAVVAALTSAAERMMLVGEDGREYTEHELDADGFEVYTPNYVSAVTFYEGGDPGFYVDCKGAIEPAMATQFRQVPIEELQRHGVTSAHVRVPD